MSEEFSAELSALRDEVGKFLLELLKGDNGRIYDDVADRLANRLQQHNYHVDLASTDRRALDELSRQLAEASGVLGRPSQTAARSEAAKTYSLVFSDPQHPQGDEPGEQNLLVRYGWFAGLLVLGLILLVVGMVLTHRMPGFSHREAAAVTEVGPGAQPPTRWERVVGQVKGWQPPERDEALNALCGSPDPLATCPPLAERLKAVSADKEKTRALLTTLAKAGGQAGICPAVSRPLSPFSGLVQQPDDLELAARLTTCLMEDADQ